MQDREKAFSKKCKYFFKCVPQKCGKLWSKIFPRYPCIGNAVVGWSSAEYLSINIFKIFALKHDEMFK